jgi:hypothetical protein
VNLRLLRLAALVISDAGIVLFVLTLIFGIGIDSTITLVAVILMATGLASYFGWSALRAKEASERNGNDQHAEMALIKLRPPEFECETHFSIILHSQDGLDMKEVSAEIEIEAPADRVWEVLTDFAKFPEWNPFIRQMSGEVRTGAQLQVQLGPTGGRVMSFKPKMVNVETNREMSWLGRLLIPGLFTGEHSFTIEALDEKGVRFVQHEKFTGLLVPFMAKSLDKDTKRGFEEMNQALKERAEKGA